ncbi:hypothetical protein NQZ68_008883 [Dissostichus eleginoides]|nr:hypothetical protein NQZ68_008883 [Dissostichus eleginoides]
MSDDSEHLQVPEERLADEIINLKARRERAELTAASDSDRMELYLDLHSQPCRSVFLLAKVIGIPFEFKLVELSAGQQYSEEFGKINVMRKVPVMKDGSFVLTERYYKDLG